MAQQYRWRPSTQIINGGYEGESVGTVPSNPTWTTVEAGNGSSPWQCYYRDSTNVAKDCVSTRVVITGHDEWTASFDASNNLTVSVTTVIDSIIRDDKIETCGTIPPRSGDNWDVRIELKRYQGGPSLYNSGNIYIGQLGNIASNLILGSYTFTLAPGQNLERGSVLVQNWAAHYYGNPDPKYYDLIWVGIAFENPMPADYRPGACYNGAEWLSHNRVGGNRAVFNGATWQELRTEGAPTSTGNPPSIFHDGEWFNMSKIGKE